MITSKINIVGREVGIAWNFAAEIAFENFSGEDISVLTESVNQSADGQPKLKPKHVLYTIMAAIFAYYNGKGEDLPVTDADILQDASPADIAAAFVEVMKIMGQWSKLPPSEAQKAKEDAQGADGEKN